MYVRPNRSVTRWIVSPQPWDAKRNHDVVYRTCQKVERLCVNGLYGSWIQQRGPDGFPSIPHTLNPIFGEVIHEESYGSDL